MGHSYEIRIGVAMVAVPLAVTVGIGILIKHGRREFVKSLAGLNSEQECILRADIDFNEVPRTKFDFRVVGTSK